MRKKLHDILFMKIPVERPFRWLRRFCHRLLYPRVRPWTTNQLLVLCTVWVAGAYALGYALGKADGSYARQELEYHVMPLQLENFTLRGKLGLPQFADIDQKVLSGTENQITSPVHPATMSSVPVGVGAPTAGAGAERAAASAPRGRGGQVASAPAPGAAGGDK